MEEGKDLQDIGPYNWCIVISRTVPEIYQFSQVALISFAFLISEELLWNYNFSCNSLSALNRPSWLQIRLPRLRFSSPILQISRSPVKLKLLSWTCPALSCDKGLWVSHGPFKATPSHWYTVEIRPTLLTQVPARFQDSLVTPFPSVWGNPSSWQYAQISSSKSVNVDGVWLVKILIR